MNRHGPVRVMKVTGLVFALLERTVSGRKISWVHHTLPGPATVHLKLVPAGKGSDGAERGVPRLARVLSRVGHRGQHSLVAISLPQSPLLRCNLCAQSMASFRGDLKTAASSSEGKNTTGTSRPAGGWGSLWEEIPHEPASSYLQAVAKALGFEMLGFRAPVQLPAHGSF